MPDEDADTHSVDRSAMRASIIGFAAAAAADMLMAATLFAPSGALATTLASPAGLKTAIHQSALAQQVPYICRRGSYGRECYYVSAPDPNLRYDRPYSNGGN